MIAVTRRLLSCVLREVAGRAVLCLAAGSMALAAPVIQSVQNAAGNIEAGPGSQVAQGSIFIVKGTGLGPANIVVAGGSSAFQSTTLSGTSITVTAGSTRMNALMYYTSDKQLAALLPSNFPAGTANFFVTYNGQTSGQFTRNVTTSTPGIFTIDSSGRGAAILTFADGTVVSSSKASNCGPVLTACGAANPGDALSLWVTGLGPVNGKDETGAGLGQNMPDLPLKLWIGGVDTPVLYQGRSGCCIGEDQVVFVMPRNVPTGCAVPLILQVGNAISNGTVMPIASSGRTCTPVQPILVGADQVVSAGPLTIADLRVRKDFTGSGNAIADFADGNFIKVTLKPGIEPFFAVSIDDPPAGTCRLSHNIDGDRPLAADLAAIDGGSSFSLRGPNGSVTVPVGTNNTTISPTGTFLTDGATYTVSGTGGTQVGAFSTSFTFPPAVRLTSPQPSASFSVTRANGLPVSWTGGSAGGNVVITISSATDQSGTVGAIVECTVPANAGTFTIPAHALLALPPNNFGSLNVRPYTVYTSFPATGLTFGFVEADRFETGFFGFPLR